MLPSGWEPISLETMLLAWALAEPNEWGQGYPEGLRGKAEGGASLTTEEEAAAIRWLLAGRRGHETRVLRGLPAQWYHADLPVAELRETVLHQHWAVNYWREHGPAAKAPRTVAEIAEHPDTPESFRGDRTPDPLRTQRPIFLATDPRGPWRIAEGNHRAVAIWRAHRRGDDRYQATCRVILGVHPQMNTWGDFVK
jgi:hypothetical protein